MNGQTLLIVVLAVVAALILLPALGMAVMMGGGMMGCCGMGGMMGQPGATIGPGWLMVAFWLLVAVGIVLLLVWGARRLGPRRARPEDEPLATLQRRDARGEIGPEEYERIRSDLLRDRVGR